MDSLREEMQALRVAQNYRLGSIEQKLDALLTLERRRRPEWQWWLLTGVNAVVGFIGWFQPGR